ncbi:AMP-binding protein [candidate division NPL-UPA2 bacterium]|nr:AMP-binding protein [candidate division NPL-UPA2 bacterium]
MSKNSKQWRFMFRPDTDVGDLLALPAAIAEGKIAGKFLGNKAPPNTLLIQSVKRRGVICGADVFVRQESAKTEGIDIAFKTRSGRGGTTSLGTINFQKFIGKESDKAPLVKREPDDLALLLYTSGTTGKPKGAMLREGGFYHHSLTARAITGVNEKDNLLILLPLYHAYALNALSIPGLMFGSTLVLVPQYDPLKLLNTMTSSKTTVFAAVPTILIHLLQIAIQEKVQLPETIRLTLTGSAPVPQEVLKEFEGIFKTEIYEGYGMTECTALASINPLGKKKLSSVGKPAGEVAPEVADLKMKVVDDDGNELPPGEVGEILIKTDKWRMLGYYNRPDATAETIKDGWIYSGDLGHKDEEGYYFITDRKKDMLISGGLNIYPREIEEILCNYPKIMEAAVIGESHQTHGEVPKAFVVLKKGETATEQEILDFCRHNMAKYKLPCAIEFREALPKVLSGKILKKELRKGYSDNRELRQEMLD